MCAQLWVDAAGLRVTSLVRPYRNACSALGRNSPANVRKTVLWKHRREHCLDLSWIFWKIDPDEGWGWLKQHPSWWKQPNCRKMLKYNRTGFEYLSWWNIFIIAQNIAIGTMANTIPWVISLYWLSEIILRHCSWLCQLIYVSWSTDQMF